MGKDDTSPILKVFFGDAFDLRSQFNYLRVLYFLYPNFLVLKLIWALLNLMWVVIMYGVFLFERFISILINLQKQKEWFQPVSMYFKP